MGTAADMISIALMEVGYQEHRSAYLLDEPNQNVGRSNYTKYGAWYDETVGCELNGQPWCAMFISWVAYHSNNEGVGLFSYCPTWVADFKNKGQWHDRGNYEPSPGDIIFFRDSDGDACHVGLVYGVDDFVYTIEGNTSGTAGVVSDGGQVAQKSYSKTSSYILGYGTPAYNGGSETTTETFENSEPFHMADGLRLWTNKNITTPVYQTSALDKKIGSMSPNEQAWCVGRISNGVGLHAYLVFYHVDDAQWYEYKTGWVSYSGGTAF